LQNFFFKDQFFHWKKAQTFGDIENLKNKKVLSKSKKRRDAGHGSGNAPEKKTKKKNENIKKKKFF